MTNQAGGHICLTTSSEFVTCDKFTERSILALMRFARTVLLMVVVVALATCGLDCLAMTTPEQAMQCCNTMPCAPNGHHGQDCCKTMPSVQTALPQSSPGHTISLADAGTVIAGEFGLPTDTSPTIANAARMSHPPPNTGSQTTAPIRI